jgi:hypothetical protein
MTSSAVVFWIQQQQRRVEAEASGNSARLKGARTMADVVRLANVHVPSEIRCLAHTIPQLRTLKSAIDHRLGEILKARLLVLSKMETLEQSRTEARQLMQDCQVLRGTYAQHYRFAERESAQYLHRLQQKAPISPQNIS